MEKTPEKIKGYKDGLDLLQIYWTCFCTEDFKMTVVFYNDDEKSSSYNLTSISNMMIWNWQQVCLNKNMSLSMEMKIQMKLLRFRNEIKQIVPDVELGVLRRSVHNLGSRVSPNWFSYLCNMFIKTYSGPRLAIAVTTLKLDLPNICLGWEDLTYELIPAFWEAWLECGGRLVLNWGLNEPLSIINNN